MLGLLPGVFALFSLMPFDSPSWQPNPLFEYLFSHIHVCFSPIHLFSKLMINETLNTALKLLGALLVAEASLSLLPRDAQYSSFETRFKEWGFEKGWGDDAERVMETMRYLSEVLQAPDSVNMEKFFSRVPTTFNVVLFSVHGYFGGQVVYVLDQVLALEEELLLRIK